MANLNADVLVRVLFRKTPEQLDAIAEGAENVALGGISRIKELSTEADYSVADAGVILDAVDRVRAARDKCPNASAASLGGTTLAHYARFSRNPMPAGLTWAP